MQVYQATPPVDPKTLGIAELDALLSDGNININEVIDILTARIERRRAGGLAVIPRVLQRRNELEASVARINGVEPSPIAPWTKTPKPVLVAAPQGTAEQIAEGLIDSGVDIPSLIAALMTRLPK
ncbi:hypothetical protein UFOVP708_38 [uncultured Caudovirales phage]|uniref:Uncharacterized protein n=1 Tax=uncultured Caudovirales phage TaxID=2100421 RepID=A0A6J5NJC4_9CAUD|nr:hypothetical protein UFOVP708_38 [uncultured Caudovirales phage]